MIIIIITNWSFASLYEVTQHYRSDTVHWDSIDHPRLPAANVVGLGIHSGLAPNEPVREVQQLAQLVKGEPMCKLAAGPNRKRD